MHKSFFFGLTLCAVASFSSAADQTVRPATSAAPAQHITRAGEQAPTFGSTDYFTGRVWVYAYVGFPKSLNALGELLKVVEARKQRGIQDAPGREPSRPIPTGDALVAAGRANQTQISGAPVQGPVFDFAPVINQYLQAHLFGDIFERDNLDWQSRELATVGALAATPGVEAQLRSHMAASMRVGLTAAQLHQLTQVLAERGDAQAAQRASDALKQALAARK